MPKRSNECATSLILGIRDWRELWQAHTHSRQGWNPKQALLGRDRRIFERIVLELPCRLDNALYGQQADALTVNVSLGGIGATASVTWPEGSPIAITLDALAVSGLIVFRRPSPDGDPRQSHYGIKFQQLRFSDLIHLRRLLRQHYRGPLAVF